MEERGQTTRYCDRKQAISQAIALRKRLLRDGTLQEYKKVLIDEYFELGAIEEEHSTEQGYYMPHRAVVRSSSSTTKIRADFNSSAPSKNKKSLNDFLSSGPSLLPDFTGLLLRFREFKFAFQADIKKAFFMIAVRPEDRVYLRFALPNEDDQITWETELDQTSIAPDTPTEDQRWTRRSLLKFIASIFDPLGYITPFTIAGKILLQQSWKESNDWDAPFAGHLQERTQQWGQDIAQVSKFQVPRWIGAVEGQQYDLHLFTDASESAYACCLYICLKDSAQLIFFKGKGGTTENNQSRKARIAGNLLGCKVC